MSHAALNVAPDPHITILDVAAIPIFDVRQHTLEAYKIGKEWRIRRDHLDRHVEDRRVSAQPAPTGGLWDPDSAA